MSAQPVVVIAISAVLAFAVSATAIPGINLNVAGVIVLLVGVVALLLPLRSTRARTCRTTSILLRPTHYVRLHVEEVNRDAAGDAVTEQDGEYSSPPGSGRRDDGL